MLLADFFDGAWLTFVVKLKNILSLEKEGLSECIRMARVSPAQFVRQVRQEIGRVTWATRRDTITATITVLVMTFIAALFFLLVDWVLSGLVQVVLNFGG